MLFHSDVVEALRPQTPIVIRLAPQRDPTGLGDMLLGTLGLTGALVVGAVIAGAILAGVLFLIRSRKPLDH